MKKLTATIAGAVVLAVAVGFGAAGPASASVVRVGSYPDIASCSYAGVAQNSDYWRCQKEANGSFTLYADDGSTDRRAA